MIKNTMNLNKKSNNNKLSPSKIVEYYKCPRKYWYKYIKKIPEPKTEATIRGTIFHKVLEDFYDIIQPKKFKGLTFVQIKDFFQNALMDLLQIEWNKIGKDYENVFSSEESKDYLFEETKEFLDFYAVKEAYKVYQFLKNNKPEDKWFELNFNSRFKPKSREEYISTESVHGYIDKTINLFGKGIGIVDYKTSKTNLPYYLDKSHMIQLKVYAFLYYKEHNVLPTYGSIYYAREGETVYYEVKKEDINEVERMIKEILNKEEKIENFPKKPSKLCDFCFYKEMCDAEKN